MDGEKSYRFTLRWGQATDTDDAEGEVVEEAPGRPSEAEIRAALPDFLGSIEQVPPIFSAIKVAGQRAYDLARSRQPVELKSRRILIHDLRLVGADDRDHATFEARSGKGAYMRALARDLGRALGTCAHIVSLRRTAVGPFPEADAISLESLQSLRHSAAASEALLPVETALDDIPALALSESGLSFGPSQSRSNWRACPRKHRVCDVGKQAGRSGPVRGRRTATGSRVEPLTSRNEHDVDYR
jgi:tRNA pseudouridine55 synthase